MRIIFIICALVIVLGFGWSNTSSQGVVTVKRISSGTPTPSPNTFNDPLDNGSIDTALWDNYLTGPDGAFVTVSETTQLNMTTSGGTFTGTTAKGLITTGTRDMTGLRWSILRSQNTGGNYYEVMSVVSGADMCHVLFDASTGNIEAFTVGGSYLGDCTAGNYWSIRHNSGDDHLIFETSVDGAAWTQCTGGDIASPFDETAVKYGMWIQGLAGYNSVRTLGWNDAVVQ